MMRQPIVPKSSDGVLQVAFNGRISTDKQDIDNIEASFVPLEVIVKDIWGGPCKIEKFGEQSSGLVVDRPELIRLEKLIASGALDVLLSEDLGRIAREPETLWRVINKCQKHGVRIICPGDDLDTANERWRKTAHAAISNHCGFIDDTVGRINRTASKKFPEGGMVTSVPPGYAKLSKEEANARTDVSGLRITLNETCRPIITDGAQMLEQGYSAAVVGDFFNAVGFKPGPQVESGRWTGALVIHFYRNPLICGWRQYGKQRKYYPELAFMDEERHAALLRLLDENSACLPKGEASGAYRRRRGVIRRDTLALRQHLRCSNCNGYYYDGPNGSLRCSNSFRRSRTPCWCHFQIRLAVIIPVLVDWLLQVLERCPSAKEALLSAALQEFQRLQSTYHDQIAAMNREVRQIQQAIDNLYKCCDTANDDEVRSNFMLRIEKKITGRRDVEKKIAGIEAALRAEARPQTIEELTLDPRIALIDLAATSFGFGALLRKMMKIVTQPIQAIDSGLMRARLLVTLDLSSLQPEDETKLPVEQYVLNAFEEAQPYKDRAAVFSMRETMRQAGQSAGLSAVGKALGIGKTRTSRALKLHKLMLQEGLTQPYRVLTEPPPHASRQKKRQKKEITTATA